MDSSDPANRARSENAQEITSAALERATGSKSSKSSDGSSLSSQRSPSLSPLQNHPMTNSLISNLDLGEENRGIGSSDMRERDDKEIISSDASSANGRATPLAPSHVLGQPTSLSRPPLSSAQESSNNSSFGAPGADDSALDALMEAHQKQETYPNSPKPSSKADEPPQTPSAKGSIPNTRDASFGLDPDADPTQSVEGTPFRFAASSSSHHRHTSHNRSIYDNAEEISAPSHTTAESGAPETMKTNISHTQTVPTASATGMPRFWPRRTSRSPSETSSHHSSHSSQPPAPNEMMPQYPPSGSLTIAIFAKNISWHRRGYLLLASIAINLGLPFINGVMLGFGEIFARSIVAPYIGLAPASININAPSSRRAAGTSGAGLRYAGIGESKGAGGRVSVESWEIEPGQRAKARR